MSLFLRVCLEGSFVFFILFLLNLSGASDNVTRNTDRYLCRLVGSTPEGYDVLTNSSHATTAQVASAEATLGFPAAECGWSGLSIRHFSNSSLALYQPNSFPLASSGLGGCQEYRNCNTTQRPGCDARMLPLGAVDDLNEAFDLVGNALLIDVPESRFCLGRNPSFGDTNHAASYVATAFALVGMLVFLAFLVGALALPISARRWLPSLVVR